MIAASLLYEKIENYRIFVKRKNMDLQTRKLKIIEYLIGIKDERIFRRIETKINEARKQQKEVVKPFTKEQLIKRAKKSNKDYKNGKFMTQADLENESKEW